MANVILIITWTCIHYLDSLVWLTACFVGGAFSYLCTLDFNILLVLYVHVAISVSYINFTIHSV